MSNEKVDVITSDSLKKYCGYLLSEYNKFKYGNGGRVFIDLNQFYSEGTIKDLLYKNTSNKRKADVLNLYKDKILHFASLHEISVELYEYQEFINV